VASIVKLSEDRLSAAREAFGKARDRVEEWLAEGASSNYKVSMCC
jgi:CRISPR/Cas system CMR-associated protein Cmr5 small subunit